MPIALDSAVNGPQGTATSWTWSHTCSGVERILFVFGHQISNISGITYNGVSMTAIGATGDVNLWYLVNPSTGANNIVASGSSAYSRFCSASYTGVDQVNPINASAGVSPGTVSTITGTLTTTVADCWLVMGDRGAGTQTAGTNTTARCNPGGDGQELFVDSNAARAAGSNSVQINGTSGTYYAKVAAIAPTPISLLGNPLFFRGGFALG